METLFLKDTKGLLTKLKEKKLHLTKERGQNFFIDAPLRKKIVKSIPESPCILEIGAGIGHFTLYLELKTERLISIELDKGFIPILKETFPKIEVVHTDFLKFSPLEYSPHLPLDTLIIGNIPYNLSTKIIDKTLKFPFLPSYLGFMLEKDFVKEKLLNTKEPLGLKIALFYDIETKFEVSKESFFPRPKKDSLFILLKKRDKVPFSPLYSLKLIDHLFQHRKSPISKALKNLLSLDSPPKLEKILPLRIHEIEFQDLEKLYVLLITDNLVCQKFHSQVEPL